MSQQLLNKTADVQIRKSRPKFRRKSSQVRPLLFAHSTLSIQTGFAVGILVGVREGRFAKHEHIEIKVLECQ